MAQLLNNRYKPQKMLGHGGMGKVYLMMDTHTQQQVAVKECFVSQKEQHVVERIKREYYFMTKIEHEHLVKGLDFFYHKDRYFIVMEYVEGITLSDFLRQHVRSITLEKQLQIAGQICDAVAALNANDIIHRDIKPENIILTADDLRPKLLDFGIAKAVNGELVTITKTNNIIGTPTYMTPEQVDPRIEMRGNLDVFSLGIVFYQFLAWLPHSPFYAGQIVSTLDGIVNKELPILFPETRDAQKKYIAKVIAWALRKNPRERIASVQELQKLLCCGDEKKMSEVLQKNVVYEDYGGSLSSLEPVKKTPTLSYIRIVLLLAVNSILLLWLYYNRNTLPSIDTQQKPQQFAENDSMHVIDYTPQLVEFSTANLQREWSPYDQGMLWYRMREKNHQYKNKAVTIWQKDTQSVMSRYQLFYVAMLDFIVSRKSAKKVQDLYTQSKRCISDLETLSNKSPLHLQMLKNCRHFQEVLEIVSIHRKISQNKEKVTSFFEKNLQANGFGNMYLAYHDDVRVNQKLECLHRALRMIPQEEFIYTKLIELYIEFGFYEKVAFLHRYLCENINPHLLSADIGMIDALIHQKKMSEAKEFFDRLAGYEIFTSTRAQISWCEYHVVMGNMDTARIILSDLLKRPLNDKEFIIVEGLKVVIEQQIEVKFPVAVLKAARLSILKGDFALAVRCIQYINALIAQENNGLSESQVLRIQSRLYRVKLLLSASDLTQQHFDTSTATIRSLSGQLMSILSVFRCAQMRNVRLGKKHVLLLKQRSDVFTFCCVYADYLFHNKRYGSAIIYWQKAMRLVPGFGDYFTQKQDHAWQLRIGSG